MTTDKREQRWCLCGWSVYGNDLERQTAFTNHWQSKKHKKAFAKRGLPLVEVEVGVEIVISKENPE